MKNITKTKIVLFIVYLAFFVGIGYFVTLNLFEKDKETLENKINLFFQNRQGIIDGILSPVQGESSKNTKLRYPIKVPILEFKIQSGGFEIYQIEKKYKGYLKSLYKSEDMWYEEKNDYGYSSSFDDYYFRAFEFILKQENYYIANTFFALKDFPNGFESKYHAIKQKNFENTIPSGWIENYYYQVKYSIDSNYYEIDEKTDEKLKALFINISISLVIGLILIFFKKIFSYLNI